MKFDRGMIKWQPFDSVISGKSIINSINQEKNKVNKPILSEEEIINLENKIIEAFYCKNKITIKYYTNGYIKTIEGKIKKIDHVSKIIYLNSITLLFNQILAIY